MSDNIVQNVNIYRSLFMFDIYDIEVVQLRRRSNIGGFTQITE